MKPFIYSIWLMPCEEQCARLSILIQNLSDQYATPAFAPHTTLCSGEWTLSEQELLKHVEQFAGQTAPIELTVHGIDWTDHWASFFFLLLTGEGDFFDRAASFIEGSHGSTVGPHLSLLYGLPSVEADRAGLRQKLAARVPPSIRFESLALVRPSTGCWKEVANWETLSSAMLAG